MSLHETLKTKIADLRSEGREVARTTEELLVLVADYIEPDHAEKPVEAPAAEGAGA